MNVKIEREKRALTQKDLSSQTLIPRDRIAKWEQGKGAPKAHDRELLRFAFAIHDLKDQIETFKKNRDRSYATWELLDPNQKSEREEVRKSIDIEEKLIEDLEKSVIEFNAQFEKLKFPTPNIDRRDIWDKMKDSIYDIFKEEEEEHPTVEKVKEKLDFFNKIQQQKNIDINDLEKAQTVDLDLMKLTDQLENYQVPLTKYVEVQDKLVAAQERIIELQNEILKMKK